MRKSKASRAHICNSAAHTAGWDRGGPVPQVNNPRFEVKHQDEPTPADPRRQHAKLAEGKKGHPTAAPHYKGVS
jgi:hypothetical protein